MNELRMLSGVVCGDNESGMPWLESNFSMFDIWHVDSSCLNETLLMLKQGFFVRLFNFILYISRCLDHCL